MRIVPFLLSLALAAAAVPAFAGDLALSFVDQAGKPVPDVVVTVKPAAGVPKGPIAFPWPYQMMQQNIMFVPHVLIVPVGTTVPFPNKDNVRHHVYSFSKPAKFDFKLYGHDETRSYTFTTAGAVAVGCNIHDSMSGYIKVVDTPFAAKSAASGAARIGAVPAGKAVMTIWHPMLRTKDNEIVVPIDVTSATLARTMTLALRASM